MYFGHYRDDELLARRRQQDIIFTQEELARLDALRENYHSYKHVLSPPELARCKFIKYLVSVGRIES